MLFKTLQEISVSIYKRKPLLLLEKPSKAVQILLRPREELRENKECLTRNTCLINNASVTDDDNPPSVAKSIPEPVFPNRIIQDSKENSLNSQVLSISKKKFN